MGTLNSLLVLSSISAIFYGLTVIDTTDGLLSAFPLFTISWKVRLVVLVTDGAENVGFSVSAFDNTTTGPPAN